MSTLVNKCLLNSFHYLNATVDIKVKKKVTEANDKVSGKMEFGVCWGVGWRGSQKRKSYQLPIEMA